MTITPFDRVVRFFYLLTRGTPDSSGLPWGSVKPVVREAARLVENTYTSKAGEALAVELATELFGERLPSGDAPQKPSPWCGFEDCDQEPWCMVADGTPRCIYHAADGALSGLPWAERVDVMAIYREQEASRPPGRAEPGNVDMRKDVEHAAGVLRAHLVMGSTQWSAMNTLLDIIHQCGPWASEGAAPPETTEPDELAVEPATGNVIDHMDISVKVAGVECARPVSIKAAELRVGDVLDDGARALRVSPWTNGGPGTDLPTPKGIEVTTTDGRGSFAHDYVLRVMRQGAPVEHPGDPSDSEMQSGLDDVLGALAATARRLSASWRGGAPTGTSPSPPEPTEPGYHAQGNPPKVVLDAVQAAYPEATAKPSTVPDAPGWWWCKEPSAEMRPVLVRKATAGSRLVAELDGGAGWPLDKRGLKWGGQCTPGPSRAALIDAAARCRGLVHAAEPSRELNAVNLPGLLEVLAAEIAKALAGIEDDESTDNLTLNSLVGRCTPGDAGLRERVQGPAVPGLDVVRKQMELHGRISAWGEALYRARHASAPGPEHLSLEAAWTRVVEASDVLASASAPSPAADGVDAGRAGVERDRDSAAEGLARARAELAELRKWVKGVLAAQVDLHACLEGES